MGKNWSTLTDPNASGGSMPTFGDGFNVNGTTVTWAQDDPSNMLSNPGFEQSPDLTQWTQTTPGTWSIDTSTFFQGLKSAKTSSNTMPLLSNKYHCDPGDQFVLAGYMRCSAGANGGGVLQINFYDAAGGTLTAGGGSTPWVSIGPTTSWAPAEVSNVIAPAGVASVRVSLYASPTTGTWYFDNISLRRLAAGDNIQVGAIATSHLAAGSLGDLGKYSSTVRAIGITSGLPTLPDANYPSGAIIFNTFDGKLYRNVSGAWSKGSDPADLIAGTIAAGVIYSGQIYCSQINAGTLNSNVIYSGTISASQVNAGDFTGCTLTLNRNGITTTINNAYSSRGYAGLQVAASGGDTTYVLGNGIAIMYGGLGIATIADAGFGGAIYLYDSGGGGPEASLEGHTGGGVLALTGTTPQIKMGGNQVLTSRRTGWSAATGTATRTSFATGSVTLPNLAQAVKALIDDLISHGIIGA